MKKVLITALVFCLISSLAVAKKNDEQPDLSEIKQTVDTQGMSLATVQNQVNEMASKFQTMNGDIGRNFKKNEEQAKTLNENDIRLQVLEDKMTMLQGQLMELQKEGLLKPEQTKRLTEYKDYAKGLEFMNSQDYDKAVQEFTNFKEQNKKSIFQSYAQYWIGEAYYMQGDYPMAIKAFQEMVSKNSKSAKAPTAVYKQGVAFMQMQSYDEAKAFFSKLMRSYPKSSEAIQASAQIKRIDRIKALQKQKELEMKMVN